MRSDADQDGKVVFVVDDEDAVRNSVKLLVESMGIRSEAYRSGEEFLEAYDGRSEGCVLLDVRMPGMSGFEVHRRLRASGSGIPVVFLTAHGADEVLTRIGPVDIIQKPFRGSELESVLRRLLGQEEA